MDRIGISVISIIQPAYQREGAKDVGREVLSKIEEVGNDSLRIWI